MEKPGLETNINEALQTLFLNKEMYFLNKLNFMSDSIWDFRKRQKRKCVVIMVGTVLFTKEEEYVLRLKKFKFYIKLKIFTEYESE